MHSRRRLIKEMQMILPVKFNRRFRQRKIRPQSAGRINDILSRHLNPEVKPHVGIFIEFQQGIDVLVDPFPTGLTPDHLAAPEQEIQRLRQQGLPGCHSHGSPRFVSSQFTDQEIGGQVHR